MGNRNQNSRMLLDRNHPSFAANKALLDMKYTDLQAAVISRGMDFDDVVNGDTGKLQSWFIKNYSNKQNKGLLEDFDIWVDQKLAPKYKENDPIRQYKKFSMQNEDGSIEISNQGLKHAKISKVFKPKRKEKKFGIFAGTKKELTYALAKDLIDKLGPKYTNKELFKKFSNTMVQKVLNKFPEALDKSVKIWMSRALKKFRPESKAKA